MNNHGRILQGEDLPAGTLPADCQTIGLEYLRGGNFKAAAHYFEADCTRYPADPNNWFGLGVALLGTLDLAQSCAAIGRGMELDPSYPLGCLIGETAGLRPSAMLDLAELLFKAKADSAATVLIVRSFNHPAADAPLVERGRKLRRTRGARRGRHLAKVVGLLCLLAGIILTSWFAYATVTRRSVAPKAKAARAAVAAPARSPQATAHR